MSLSATNRVLVISDDPGVSAALQNILSMPPRTTTGAYRLRDARESSLVPAVTTGTYQLTSASLGREALEQVHAAKAADKPFAVVFVDLARPPASDGLLMVQQLWREQPNAQVILCATCSDQIADQIATRLGKSDDFLILSKPFEPMVVRQMTWALARRWSHTRENQERTDELRRAQRQVQAILDFLPSPVCLRDLEGRFLLTNGAFSLRFRTTSEAVFGRKPEEVLAPMLAGMFNSLDDEVVNGDRPLEFEASQPPHADGPPTPWLVAKWPLYGADGRPYAICSLFTDLSRRKVEEDHLRRDLAMRAQGLMAGEVAHEFGNLLTTISGYLQVALRRLPAESNVRQPLGEIQKATNRGSILTRQLTTLGHHAALQPVEADLVELVAEQAEVLRGVLPEGITVRVASDVSPLMVRVDREQFAPALLDVALCARDAMTGGVIQVRTVVAGVMAEVHIVHPVAADQKVIDPFSGPGLGGDLGPAAARVLCEQSGGTAEMRQAVRGSRCLVMAVPLAMAIEPPAVPPAPATGPVTVLVAEDEEAVRSLVADSLREAGYRVLVGADGQEALGLAWSNPEPIDVLVTDSIMPRLDGPALAERVLSRHPRAKVLLMSGYTESDAIHHSVRGLSVDFIQKPFSLDALLQRVARLLAPPTPPAGTTFTPPFSR